MTGDFSTPVSLSLLAGDTKTMRIEELMAENDRLQELIRVAHEKEKQNVLPSEIVTKAQNMCLKAEEEMREAQLRTEAARTEASRAVEKEKSARKEATELGKKLTNIAEAQKTSVAEHKAQMDSLNVDYLSKTQECRTLVQRNISLRTEMDELTLRVAGHEALVAERNEMAWRIQSLQENLTESKVLVENNTHYRRITTEMEERVAELEKELVVTAHKVGTSEKQLTESQQSLKNEQSRNEKLIRKLRQVKETGQEKVAIQEPVKDTLLADLETKQTELATLQRMQSETAVQLESERHEKMKLLQELSELQDRFVNTEKQQQSANFQLRHQLSTAKKDLEDCKRYAGQVETERRHLCEKLHVKPDPMLGFEDTRGGGTFHDSGAMTDISSRNGLSAIDTLYLKNVLFKFIESTVKNKTSERDLLLPAVATLLGASTEEFTQLREALRTESQTKSSIGLFSFWS